MMYKSVGRVTFQDRKAHSTEGTSNHDPKLAMAQDEKKPQ